MKLIGFYFYNKIESNPIGETFDEFDIYCYLREISTWHTHDFIVYVFDTIWYNDSYKKLFIYQSTNERISKIKL